MKKLFFFLAVVAGISMTSCSSDDSGSGHSSNITATINGTATTFGSANVVATDYPAEGGYPAYTELQVAATSGTNILSFYTDRGDLGADAAWNFTLTYNGTIYYGYNLSSSISENSSNTLKGVFSGTMYSNGEETLTITNGVFEIHY